MVSPSKYKISVCANGDSTLEVADIIGEKLFISDIGRIKYQLDKTGVYNSESDNLTFYNDIALSKKFKLLQAANVKELYGVSVKIVECK